MNLFKKVIGATFVAGLATFGLAYNPISTYHYLADPGAAADDEYFYIITDSDDPAAYDANGYSIKALYAFRSKDMQNWTDFGIIYDARQVNGIGDIWASGIAKNPNDGRLYIVFPDGGGGGIGLIGADSIAGPWTNPLPNNKKLINNWGGGFADCDNIGWCFDPAIFYDTDGTGYFTFGGGSSDSRPAADNNNNIFNIYKFNKDMKGFDTNPTQLKIGGPRAMEASYIHKYKDNYYLSYSTADLRIAYGMSKSPTGPYTYKGIFMGNPNINGQNINANNNNHHGIAEFKGHWYVVYHDRRIANGYDGLEKIPADDGKPNPVPAFHRSVSVDEFTYAADGSMNSLTFTKEGPKQIENFDPYDWYPALTSSKQKGVRSRSNWAPGKVAENILLPLASRSESWIRVSGVDFGKGATGFTVEAASTADNNKIEIRKGSATGTLAGSCTLKKTGSKATFAETSCDVDGLSGVVEQLFLVFKGSQDSTMAIKAWGFEGSGKTPPEPQKPFGGKAWAIPGKIEAENFDVPGTGRGDEYASYSDTDAGNNACAENNASKAKDCTKNYREDTDVDIKTTGTGYTIGWGATGEWLEYTVDVAKAGDYTMFAAASSGSGGAYKLSLVNADGSLTDLTDSVMVDAAADADDFDSFAKKAVNVKFEKAGEQVIRFTILKQYVDVDFINFVAGKDAEDDAPLENSSVEDPTAIGSELALDIAAETQFDVFDLNGSKLASFKAKTMNEASSMWQKSSASAKVQGVCLIRNRASGKVARVRAIH